jgi:hypothetical protein
VLYELTTNTRPFDRESEFETLEAIVRGEFPPPSRVVPNYPADLEPIVLRLLENRPKDRYPSAGALLVDLDRVISRHSLDLSNEVLAAHILMLLGPEKNERKATIKIRPPAEAPEPKPVTIKADRLGTAPTIMELPHPPTEPAVLSPEAMVPIDRVAARLDELLETIAPGATDARDLSISAIAQLVGRAMRSLSRGDHEKAVLAAELALSAARPEDGVDALLESNESLFLSVFTAYIGDQSRMAAVSQHIEQLVGIEIDQRAVFLLTRIDGTLTARELLVTCGLPPRDACRHLSQLILRKLVVLV